MLRMYADVVRCIGLSCRQGCMCGCSSNVATLAIASTSQETEAVVGRSDVLGSTLVSKRLVVRAVRAFDDIDDILGRTCNSLRILTRNGILQDQRLCIQALGLIA